MQCFIPGYRGDLATKFCFYIIMGRFCGLSQDNKLGSCLFCIYVFLLILIYFCSVVANPSIFLIVLKNQYWIEFNLVL